MPCGLRIKSGWSAEIKALGRYGNSAVSVMPF